MKWKKTQRRLLNSVRYEFRPCSDIFDPLVRKCRPQNVFKKLSRTGKLKLFHSTACSISRLVRHHIMYLNKCWTNKNEQITLAIGHFKNIILTSTGSIPSSTTRLAFCDKTTVCTVCRHYWFHYLNNRPRCRLYTERQRQRQILKRKCGLVFYPSWVIDVLVALFLHSTFFFSFSFSIFSSLVHAFSLLSLWVQVFYSLLSSSIFKLFRPR